jgi:hypothetical protein
MRQIMTNAIDALRVLCIRMGAKGPLTPLFFPRVPMNGAICETSGYKKLTKKGG